MVFRITDNSGDHHSQETEEQLMTMAAASSLSSSSEDDLEEGGYSSQEEQQQQCGDHNHKEIIAASKFIPMRAGKPARRRSQCERLRQRSEPPSLDHRGQQKQKRRAAPTSHPVSFRRWSTLVTSNNGELPKTIQFYPPSSNNNDDESSSSSYSKKLLLLGSNHPMLLPAIAMALLCSLFLLASQQIELNALRKELEITNQHRLYMERSRATALQQVSQRNDALEQYKHTQQQMTKINHDLSESMAKLRQEQSDVVEELGRLRAVEKRVNWTEGRWDRYVEGLREQSRQIVLEKFGQGPHQVELQVRLPSSSTQETIKIELAPLDMMPHSVHTFLEQVHGGSWDNALFDVHAGHVLMASSSSNGGNQQTATSVSARTPTLLFPEYNANYPHDKYTIAFPTSLSSTDTPPNLYINMQPNDIHHSPRIEKNSSSSSQDDENVEERYIEGDSCFGKIVDGDSQRIIDRMDQLNVVRGSRVLEERVMIVSARIVGR